MATYPRDSTVHELFAGAVQARPDAPALIVAPADGRDPAHSVSYAQLDARAAALAGRLVAAGVAPGDFVPLLLGRSADLVAGMLAVLRAGAAYVPLDPRHPTERLRYLLRDSGAATCLTERRHVTLIEDAGVRALDVAADDGAPPLTTGVARPADAPAYMMYTSGSTGRPKGVVVPHRAIVRLVFGADYARLDATRVLLQLAPTSFDASTFEIWGALLHGARCVLAPDTAVPDLARLRAILETHGVTTLWLTASLFNVIVDQAPGTVATVEELLTGGEALSVPHVRRAQDLLPRVQLVNGYGPTENTTFTCCHRIPPGFPRDARSVPIGRPIPHTTVHLLDDQMAPVPDGESGELWIGGDGLALGYHGRPELTAERFRTAPWDPAVRLYASGDLGRRLADGTFEFLGRRDDQVKIRGHRVELGEVEAALRTAPGVGHGVVVLRDMRGEQRLVAYVTPDDGGAPEPTALRSYLADRLPDHMIPSHFVTVEAIPLTANGKADRRALPAPGRLRPALDRPAVAPTTPRETWIARLWREVLDMDELGVHDRFFDLGGTSLLAMRLMARLGEEVHAALPPLLLFRAPTVAGLAALLEAEYPALQPPVPHPPAGTPAGTPANPLLERAAQRREALQDRRRRRQQGER